MSVYCCIILRTLTWELLCFMSVHRCVTLQEMTHRWHSEWVSDTVATTFLHFVEHFNWQIPWNWLHVEINGLNDSCFSFFTYRFLSCNIVLLYCVTITMIAQVIIKICKKVPAFKAKHLSASALLLCVLVMHGAHTDTDVRKKNTSQDRQAPTQACIFSSKHIWTNFITACQL